MRRFLSCAALLGLAACGATDQVAGGTVGTETGNALTGMLMREDGSPAASAVVVARPHDAVDSMSSAIWQRGQADDQGAIRMHLPSGRWTLEARSGALSRRTDVVVDGDVAIRDTLRPGTLLRGRVLGEGIASISLPGLARSSRIGSDGTFEFLDVPAGAQRLESSGMQWSLPAGGDSLALAADGSGRILRGAHALALPVGASLRCVQIADTLVPDGNVQLWDGRGEVVPLALGLVRAGSRRMWVGTRTAAPAFLGMDPNAVTVSPFERDPALTLAWIPELGEGNLTGSRPGLAVATGAVLDSSGEGRYRRIPLGMALGMFDSGTLPDTDAFSLMVRARLNLTAVGSLWLVDWTDLDGAGLRIGIGAGKLSVRAGLKDTAIDLADSGTWTSWGASWDGQDLSVSSDGIERMRVRTDALGRRASWISRRIGQGGGLDVSTILAWRRAVDGPSLSAPVLTLP
jgi:hypothetical protein